MLPFWNQLEAFIDGRRGAQCRTRGRGDEEDEEVEEEEWGRRNGGGGMEEDEEEEKEREEGRRARLGRSRVECPNRDPPATGRPSLLHLLPATSPRLLVPALVVSASAPTAPASPGPRPRRLPPHTHSPPRRLCPRRPPPRTGPFPLISSLSRSNLTLPNDIHHPRLPSLKSPPPPTLPAARCPSPIIT